jgi:RimJ/RimL family protein N-acetyltransferase
MVSTLTTPRLLLRQWQDEDLGPFRQMNADPQVMAFYPALLSAAESDALATRISGLISERGWGFWALELRATGQFIGYTGLHVPSAALPFQPCVETGWRLAVPFWGQGYATEAARAAVAFGFGTLNLAEIVSFTSLLNLRSQRVMERLGMQRQAGSFEHPTLPEGHPLRPHCLYRIRSVSRTG